MNKYQEIISKLKTKGIEVDSAMSSAEISKIEEFYGLAFPVELRHLFAIGLPVSKGFYNWRDMSTSNVQRIKETLSLPIKDLERELEDDLWCDEWGNKPSDTNETHKILLKHYINAPKLVPIYVHRYMPFIPNSVETPVFSIMGSDIIYYGENLISYLEIEFKIKEYDNNMNCKYVDFWSDLL